MAKGIVKKLVSEGMVEMSLETQVTLTEGIRQSLSDELGIEDRLNEEVRQILNQYSDEMRKQGASYQEMFKKVKGQLARDRKLILR